MSVDTLQLRKTLDTEIQELSVEEQSQPKCSNSSLHDYDTVITWLQPLSCQCTLCVYCYECDSAYLFLTFCLCPSQRIRTVELHGSHSSGTLKANPVAKVKSCPLGAKRELQSLIVSRAMKSLCYLQNGSRLSGQKSPIHMQNNSTCMSHTYTALYSSSNILPSQTHSV